VFATTPLFRRIAKAVYFVLFSAIGRHFLVRRGTKKADCGDGFILFPDAGA
jgi:hypothetical protein